MQHIVHESVISAIRNSYVRGVHLAQRGYVYAHEDEDVVTGALGQALLAEDQVVVEDGTVYVWRTTYHKFRGRGKNATEKLLGADGIFQIEVVDAQNNTLFRKGLLFQAKNQWRGKDPKLVTQAALLACPDHAAVIVDYTMDGFYTCLAEVVHQAEGDRNKIPLTAIQSLDITLGTDFLYCRQGVEGLFYNFRTKTLYLPSGWKKISYKHVIDTKVLKIATSQQF